LIIYDKIFETLTLFGIAVVFIHRNRIKNDDGPFTSKILNDLDYCKD